MTRLALAACLGMLLVLLLSHGACTEGGSLPDQPGATLTIAVASLSLDGVSDARYAVTVTNAPAGAGDVVWTRTLTSSQFGDGAGSLSFVGPCDAGVATDNSVTLTLEALFDAQDVEIPPSTYQNPGTLVRNVPCVANSDTRVAFDIAIVRQANQGFFDVAVSFDDIFCSAKLDCVDDTGTQDLTLLHDPDTGDRALTAVMGLACTASPTGTTYLYMDDPTISCDGLAGNLTIVDASAIGNVDLDTLPNANAGGYLFGAAVYRGAEDLAAKSYWNIALGLDADALAAAGNCTLGGRATASETAYAETSSGFELPAGTLYPVIDWNLTLTNATGRVCTAHPVNGAPAGVATRYVGYAGDDPTYLRHRYLAPDEVVTANTPPMLLSITGPSPATASEGPITFTLNFSETVIGDVDLGAISLDVVGDVTADIATSGSGTSRTVTLSNLVYDGTLGITVAAGAIDDADANPSSNGATSAAAIVTHCGDTRLTNTPFASGAGSQADPYVICTEAQLNAINGSGDLDKAFQLREDLDLSSFTGTSFNRIGVEGTPFTGTFDGLGHTVSNFTWDDREGNDRYVGLFGAVEGDGGSDGVGDGVITDVHMVDPQVYAKEIAGALVGGLDEGGHVSNSSTTGGRILGRAAIGGLVGRVINYDSDEARMTIIEDSWSRTSVRGAALIGGLLGQAALDPPGAVDGGHLLIEDSWAAATVVAHDQHGGGLIGALQATGQGAGQRAVVNRSHARGFTSARIVGGGLIGNLASNDNGKVVITESFSRGGLYLGGGTLDGTFDMGGGLIGSVFAGAGGTATLTDVFSETEVEASAGYINAGGLIGRTDASPGAGSGGTITVTRAFAAGAVKGGATNEGGVRGGAVAGGTTTFTDVFWRSDGGTEAVFADGAGASNPAGTTSKTLAELRDVSTYPAGYDFGSRWRVIDDLAFPEFQYLNMPCDAAAMAATPFAGGDGSAGAPYLICSGAQLGEIGANMAYWSQHFVLGQNVDAADYVGPWPKIGNNVAGQRFSGTLDGDGFVVRNYTFTTDANNRGLISIMGDGGVVSDIGMIDPFADSGASVTVSALVGYINGDATVARAFSLRGSLEGRYHVGPLVGWATDADITDSFGSTSVSIVDQAGDVNSPRGWGGGGAVGVSDASRLTNVGGFGDVDILGIVHRYSGQMGGLLGIDICSTTIVDSFAHGTIGASANTNWMLGGLIGSMQTNTECTALATVSRSFATGDVGGTTAGEWMGGLVGHIARSPPGVASASALVAESFALGDVTAGASSPQAFGVGSLIGVAYIQPGALAGVEIRIRDCYAEGDATTTQNEAATVLGRLDTQSGAGIVERVYTFGAASGAGNVGAVIGNLLGSGSTVTGTYWNSDVNSLSDVGSGGGTDLAGASSLTGAQMLVAGNFAPFNFTTTWRLPTGTRPILRANALYYGAWNP